MSCWFFFIFMWKASTSLQIPVECQMYIDDPVYSQFVMVMEYIDETEINSDGNGQLAMQA